MIRVLGLCFFLPLLTWAQPKAYRAQTIRSEVDVFKTASFDAPIIATLPGGKIYDISTKKFNGAFYHIRVRPGLLGYVSDADVRPLFKVNQKGEALKDKASERISAKKKKFPFQFTQYAGLQYSVLQFQEDTMGDKRKENLGFYGVKISGPNLIIEGAMPTEMNFIFHSGAPNYYSDLTGHSADGWVFMMDFLLQNYYPQRPNVLTFFGFGPMMKYSKFLVALTDQGTGKTSDYSLEDISIGAVFNAGVAFRIDRIALRGELQYFWEKQAYLGAGLSAQFAF